MHLCLMKGFVLSYTNPINSLRNFDHLLNGIGIMLASALYWSLLTVRIECFN